MQAGIVDTHAHLCDESFDVDREAVIKRAQEAGVHSIVVVGENEEDAQRNIALAQQYPCLKPAAGIYPQYADILAADAMISRIQQHQQQLFAIGEVGLDFWIAKEEPDRELQREVFQKFILLGKELNLPLNVHSRSAGRHAVAMLLENNAEHVQMHAYDGKASTALPAVEAGYYFSIPPSIIRSRQKQKLLKHLPLSCLLVESDSPVLGPDPGKRNEPMNVTIALQAIAEIKETQIEHVREKIWENSCTLYGIKV